MCGILHYFDFKQEHDGSKSTFEIYGPFWLLWSLTDTEWKCYLCFIDISKGNLNLNFNIGSKLCLQHIHKGNAMLEFRVDEQMFTKK